jgi:hypothetical protein
VTGNGDPQPLHECAYDPQHKFTTLDARYGHEPSCPSNPDRVPNDENPER